MSDLRFDDRVVRDHIDEISATEGFTIPRSAQDELMALAPLMSGQS